MSRKLSQITKNYLEHLAKAGDMFARAIVESMQEAHLTKGVLASGVIHVKGQVVDGIGNPVLTKQDIYLKSTSSNGGTIAITSTSGTTKFGSGTGEVWLQSTTIGAFEVDVEDGTPGELVLLEVRTADGISSILELQY